MTDVSKINYYCIVLYLSIILLFKRKDNKNKKAEYTIFYK